MNGSRVDEFNLKLGRLRDFLQDQALDGLVLARHHNLSWLACGGNCYIDLDTDLGVALALVTAEGVTVFTRESETSRLRVEELSGLPIDIVTCNWYEDPLNLIIERAKPLRMGADYPLLPGIRNIDRDLLTLRYPLTGQEIDKYRILGKRCREIVEETARHIRPGISEFQVTGDLSAELISQGIRPTVILVASDERILNFRHPMPSSKRINKSCLVIVCARMHGLTVAMTRMVYFGETPTDLRSRHKAVAKVSAAYIISSRPGVPLSSVLMEGIETYKELGYPDEWRYLHQGGILGYENRESIATPTNMLPLSINQALAWNPTIAGTKSEDSILLTESGFEFLTLDSDSWPTIDVQEGGMIVRRPDILEI